MDRSVLIPRHETETLIEAVKELVPETIIPSELSVLDLGVGSGALAITLKLERPDWNLLAIDISPEALTTASANARFHQAAITFVLSDGFQAVLGESFDLIVCNPPYIGEEEPLAPEVALFEPQLALFADNGGMAFYEMLAVEAPSYLNDGGLLVIEVGYRQAAAVTELFLNSGWSLQGQFKDLSGVERVLAWRHDFENRTSLGLAEG